MDPVVKNSRVLNPSTEWAHTHTRMYRVKVQTLPEGKGYEASIQTPQKVYTSTHVDAGRAAMFVQQDVRNAELAGDVFPTK